MSPIAGIGSVPELREARPVRARSQQGTTKTTENSDDVTFSPKALEASQAAKVVRAAEEAIKASAIRNERVEAAKKSIREGSYQVATVVEQVAARLTPYL